MKTLRIESVKINNKEVKVYIENGGLFIETKAGAMRVSSVSKSRSNITFVAGENEVTAPFVGNAEVVRAMFSVCRSEKAKDLVLFESYEEYLRNKGIGFGASFDVDGMIAAYKY